MGNGDPVTQKQFYERMDNDKKEVLGAVGKLGDTVNGTSITVAKMETKLERVDALDKKLDTLKTWDRIDSIVSGAVAVALAALGINRGGE